MYTVYLLEMAPERYRGSVLGQNQQKIVDWISEEKKKEEWLGSDPVTNEKDWNWVWKRFVLETDVEMITYSIKSLDCIFWLLGLIRLYYIYTSYFIKPQVCVIQVFSYVFFLLSASHKKIILKLSNCIRSVLISADAQGFNISIDVGIEKVFSRDL